MLESGHLADRMDEWAASGTSHGIEYRYPLLDRRILEFAHGLPLDLFRRGRHRRWIMRKAMEGLLPPEVCWNASKSDPSRTDLLATSMAEALPGLAQRIREQRTRMKRAKNLDLDQLLTEMDQAAFRSDPRPMRLVKALQFLDLA